MTTVQTSLVSSNSQVNPYSRRAVIQRSLSRPSQIYQNLNTRINSCPNHTISDAIKSLQNRTKNQPYVQDHFGRVELLSLDKFVINIDNQREVDWDHVAYIIENFDPRIVQAVNAIKLGNGMYSVPEGQHTLVALKILDKNGLLPKDFKVITKVIDENLTVPGSSLNGEAFGNLLFRLINTKGRKAIEAYYIHRSRVHGVRYYGSTLIEDVQAEEIEQSIDRNQMFVAPSYMARSRSATPGMVTYIHGLNSISCHDSQEFNTAINDLDWTLKLHNNYFSSAAGVDGGFILAFGRYARLARLSNVTITPAHESDLMRFFRMTYGSPGNFHKLCKLRLKAFQQKKNVNDNWSDTCLLSILILDFEEWCNTHGVNHPVLNDLNINNYVSGQIRI